MKDLKQSIGYFVKYMKPFKNSVLIMVFLLLIAMIAQVVAPYYMGQAVTSLGRFLAHKAHAMADFRQFMLLMCTAFFFQVFAQLIAWVIMSVFNAEATNSMRISLFKKLQKMTRFPNDSLDAALCHGDVLLQICANTQDTVIHALRDIIKHTPDLLSVRWKREGFISDHAARSKGKETPINLLGFKDGTANPDSQNDKLMQKVVWVTADQQEPAWTIGGSYQAVRLIQFRVEFWDRTPLKEQQTIFGRDKQTGAPLGMQHEHDVPDYASDPEGKVIALDSHIRLANPRTAESESSLMLRRGYSYSLGVTNSGQLDMGLLFVCYQHDLEKGFLTVQKRLNGEALEEYVKPIGGGYFFALPGVKDANDYFGSALLRV